VIVVLIIESINDDEEDVEELSAIAVCGNGGGGICVSCDGDSLLMVDDVGVVGIIFGGVTRFLSAFGFDGMGGGVDGSDDDEIDDAGVSDDDN